MEKITIKTNAGATAEVYTHGAHITSWKTPAGKELLFVSKQALFQPPKAIRGGVPVCFPQFGMMGPMPTQHGFARNTAFTVESQEDYKVTMVMQHDGSGQPSFPHPFLLRISTSICDNLLMQELQVTNTGDKDLTFTTALHTYFRVQDIAQVRVRGLQGVSYLDNLQGQAKCEEASEEVVLDQEVDRVYLSADKDIQIVEGGQVSMEVRRVNLPDAVLWNPWVSKAAAMSDFGDEEYKEMLCIEPAVAGSGAVTLAPGAVWTGQQILRHADTTA